MLWLFCPGTCISLPQELGNLMEDKLIGYIYPNYPKLYVPKFYPSIPDWLVISTKAMIAASSHPFLAKATTDLCIIQQMWTALGVYAPQPKPFAFVLNCCSKLQQNKPSFFDSGNHPQVDFSFVNWQILSIYLSRSWEKARIQTPNIWISRHRISYKRPLIGCWEAKSL